MSGLRLFKSSLVYHGYARSFYGERPRLAEQPFSRQMADLLADGFGFGGAWKHHLEANGRCDVMEVILNAEPAQKQWAKEHGFRCGGDDWSNEILAAQLEEFKPHVWFCHGWLKPDLRLRLRRAHPTIRYVIGYDGTLKDDPQALAGCDAVLSCVRESAALYTRAGLQGYWMPWGFDPGLLARLEPGRQRYQVSFCGSMIMQKHVGHFERPRLLDRLQRIFELAVFSGDLTARKVERSALSHLYRRHFDLAWRTFQCYPSVRRLRRSNLGERYGLAMLQTLADSRVTLNMHGYAVRTAANIRLFEATGAGTCLLTDWKDDLPSVFEPDREVVAFRSHEECVEKLRYLLDHEEERRKIAAAGQERCLRDHDIGGRILKFADDVLSRV
jgi:spore maturation protein CgeB